MLCVPSPTLTPQRISFIVSLLESELARPLSCEILLELCANDVDGDFGIIMKVVLALQV